MLRWHTFRIVLLTSCVWIAVGFAILAFYSDCWGVNCSSKSPRPLPQSDDEPVALPVHDQQQDDNRGDDHDSAASNNSPKRDIGTPLPPYTSKQLKLWKPVGECEATFETEIAAAVAASVAASVAAILRPGVNLHPRDCDAKLTQRNSHAICI